MDSNKKLESSLSQFGTSVDKISETLESCIHEIDYDELSIENKIRYDLFLAYSMNGLLWLYLRTIGQDPSQTVIKTELNRIKESMSELQRAIDRKTIMPKIDQGAAKRFVRHSLWNPNDVCKKPKHKFFED